MSVTVSYGYLLSLTVCPSAMELLPVSHCLLRLLAISNCFSSPMKMLRVSYFLLWLLAISHCSSQRRRVAAYLSLSAMVFGCL